MNYIKLLNAFNDLMRTEALPAAAQVLYYKLLDIWNRSGRREWVSVSNQRLMVESVIRDEKTLIRNRDKLIHVNVIDFKSGKKGQPSRYCIKKIYWDNASEYDSINASKCDSVYASTNASTNARHNRDRVRDRDNILCPDARVGIDDKNAATSKTGYTSSTLSAHSPQVDSAQPPAGDSGTVDASTSLNASTNSSVYARVFASENKLVLDTYIAKMTLTPSNNELSCLDEYIGLYGGDMVMKAIERAATRNIKLTGVRGVKYIGGILRDWQLNGCDEAKNNTANKKYTKPAVPRGIQELEDIIKGVS